MTEPLEIVAAIVPKAAIPLMKATGKATPSKRMCWCDPATARYKMTGNASVSRRNCQLRKLRSRS